MVCIGQCVLFIGSCEPWDQTRVKGSSKVLQASGGWIQTRWCRLHRLFSLRRTHIPGEISAVEIDVSEIHVVCVCACSCVCECFMYDLCVCASLCSRWAVGMAVSDYTQCWVSSLWWSGPAVQQGSRWCQYSGPRPGQQSSVFWMLPPTFTYGTCWRKTLSLWSLKRLMLTGN